MNNRILELENDIFCMESVYDFNTFIDTKSIELMEETTVDNLFQKIKDYIKDLFDKLKQKIIEYKFDKEFSKIEKTLKKK